MGIGKVLLTNFYGFFNVVALGKLLRYQKVWKLLGWYKFHLGAVSGYTTMRPARCWALIQGFLFPRFHHEVSALVLPLSLRKYVVQKESGNYW